MYSRDFGEGIRSEGNLREYMRSAAPPPPPAEKDTPKAETKEVTAALPVFGSKVGDGIVGSIKKLLRDIETDDLILIGIGILLLLDSDTDNDTLVLLILLMLFF